MMTTFSLVMTLLGAASVAVNLMRLFEHLQKPQVKRRARTA